ncbi:MAG TPA: hypothetical protein DCE41_09080 [Cytophagales bacterium]|nr:hypothetical protein [Cytophagales bacterium]HAA18235.1 hypothetical protein [Cytophagales bacterium]HAP58983.1 hypothetical protein [Cytophagales bacterium]
MMKITQFIRLGLASVVLMLASTQLQAQIPGGPPSIYGPLDADCGEAVTYFSNYNENLVDTYTWTFTYTNATIHTETTPQVNVTLPNARGTLTILLRLLFKDGTIDYLNYTTQYGRAADRPGPIQGDVDVCGNGNTEVYSIDPVDRAANYRWTVDAPLEIVGAPGNGRQLIGGTSITVRIPTSSSITRQIRVASVTDGTCSATSMNQTLTLNIGPRSYFIEGPTTVSQNSVVSYELNGPNLSNFSWSTSGGLNILSGSTLYRTVVEAPGAGSANVSVSYRSCGALRSASKNVTVTSSGGGGPGFGGFSRNAPLQEQVGLSSASLYPNPATDMVTLTAEKPLQQVVVVNIMGQVLKTLDNVSGTTASIEVKDLEAGTYFVIAQDEGGKHTYQLVVE